MAELFLSDRLQPSLLDRLTDLEPGSKLESRAAATRTSRGCATACCGTWAG